MSSLRRRACGLSVLLVPALALTAADNTYPGTTKSNPPPVATSGSYLVDKTIPAYGVLNQVPHYTDSRANALYLEIHQVLADVESQVMSGTYAVPPPNKKKTSQTDEAPAPVVGDARINALLSRLVELDTNISFRTYLEQWHIDNSFSDLNRATDLLAISGHIGAATVDKVKATKPQKPEAAVAPKADDPAAVPTPEAPAADAPAAPPVTEPPPAETPAVEAPPVTEPPPAEVPAVEVPAVEVPAAEAPAVEVPAAEAPAVEVPAAEAPAAPEPGELPAAEPGELPSAEPPAVDAPTE